MGTAKSALAVLRTVAGRGACVKQRFEISLRRETLSGSGHADGTDDARCQHILDNNDVAYLYDGLWFVDFGNEVHLSDTPIFGFLIGVGILTSLIAFGVVRFDAFMKFHPFRFGRRYELTEPQNTILRIMAGFCLFGVVLRFAGDLLKLMLDASLSRRCRAGAGVNSWAFQLSPATMLGGRSSRCC